MNSIQDLNTASATAFEFTDFRTSDVKFVTNIFTDFTLTKNEGDEFNLPLGFDIKEIINYTLADAYIEIDLTGSTGNNVDWGTLPVHLTTSTPVAEVYRIGGFKSSADWQVIKNNIVIELSNSYNGALSIPVTVYWTNSEGSTSAGYTISLTINEVLSLTQITDIHYYTHNTAAVIANPPQLVDSGNYTWTVNVEGQRSQVIDEIAYTGSDAAFAWDNSLKVATFIGTLAGVNTALGDMTLKVQQNTFWDFDLEYTSSNDNNSETDVSTISCKTTDQSVMKLSIDDTYASPTVARESISGGPRITATDGYFLTTIEPYDSNDIQSLYADDTNITGAILESEGDVHYPGWRTAAATPFDNIPAADLVRTFTVGSFTIPCYYSTVYSGIRQQNYISNDNSLLCRNDGFTVQIYENSGSGYEGTAILQHYNEVYTSTTNLAQLAGACISGDGSTVIASYVERDSSQNLVDERIFVYKVVSNVWTKTHEIQNPHQITGNSQGSDNTITDGSLFVSENGNFISAATSDKKLFVLAYDSGLNSWSSRQTNITPGTDYNDFYKSQFGAPPVISSDGGSLFYTTGRRTTLPTTYAENPYIWIATWNGSIYTELTQINSREYNLPQNQTAYNLSYDHIDITPAGDRLVVQISGSDTLILRKDGSTWNKGATLGTYKSLGAKISPDGTTVITMYNSGFNDVKANFFWDVDDWLPLQYVNVNKLSGVIDTNTGFEIWNNITVIPNDIAPPSSAETGLDFAQGSYLHDVNNTVFVQHYTNNGATNGTTPEIDGFIKVYSWDELGRTIDNVGKSITIFDTHTSHNALLWDFDLLPTANLTTPIELVYTTTQYPSTGGATVVSSRNHFIRPV